MEINSQDKLLLININKTFEDDISTYNAVRFAWKINKDRAEKADYVLAIHKGVCHGVFAPDQWLPADDIEFIHFARESDEQLKGRYGFKGCVADDYIMQRYKNKKLPDKLLWRRGAATPFKYTYE